MRTLGLYELEAVLECVELVELDKVKSLIWHRVVKNSENIKCHLPVQALLLS